jgi:hypothetical protein
MTSVSQVEHSLKNILEERANVLAREDLEADAKRRGQPVRERAWKLADWTILLTDAPADLLSLGEGFLPSPCCVAYLSRKVSLARVQDALKRVPLAM